MCRVCGPGIHIKRASMGLWARDTNRTDTDARVDSGQALLRVLLQPPYLHLPPQALCELP